MAAAGVGAAPVWDVTLSRTLQQYDLIPLTLPSPIREQLFVITAERQFSHVGIQRLCQTARCLLTSEPMESSAAPTSG
jgi:hypothetical protein